MLTLTLTMINQSLEAAITSELKPYGFKKKGPNWYLEGTSSIALLNLQKSNFNNTYYINIGVLLKELSNLSFPPENKLSVRTRLTQLAPNKEELEDNLNLENNSIPIELKVKNIRKSICSLAIPFLTKSISRAELREALAHGKADKFLITLEAKKLLGLP